jgi:hypothetical protein
LGKDEGTERAAFSAGIGESARRIPEAEPAGERRRIDEDGDGLRGRMAAGSERAGLFDGVLSDDRDRGKRGEAAARSSFSSALSPAPSSSSSLSTRSSNGKAETGRSGMSTGRSSKGATTVSGFPTGDEPRPVKSSYMCPGTFGEMGEDGLSCVKVLAPLTGVDSRGAGDAATTDAGAEARSGAGTLRSTGAITGWACDE